MKKLLLLSLLSIFLFSCSSDEKEDESYLVYVNKTNVTCLDEIVEMNLFYYENNQPITSLNQAKQVVEKANKEALENYESGKISCQYKYTYLKIEDGTALPKP